MLRFGILSKLFLKGSFRAETALNYMNLVKETYAVSIDCRDPLIIETDSLNYV